MGLEEIAVRCIHQVFKPRVRVTLPRELIRGDRGDCNTCTYNPKKENHRPTCYVPAGYFILKLKKLLNLDFSFHLFK